MHWRLEMGNHGRCPCLCLMLLAKLASLLPDVTLGDCCMRVIYGALCMFPGSLMDDGLRSAGYQALPALLRRAATGSRAAMGAPDLKHMQDAVAFNCIQLQ